MEQDPKLDPGQQQLIAAGCFYLANEVSSASPRPLRHSLAVNRTVALPSSVNTMRKNFLPHSSLQLISGESKAWLIAQVQLGSGLAQQVEYHTGPVKAEADFEGHLQAKTHHRLPACGRR